MKQFLMYWDQGYGDETLIRPIFYKEFDGSLHDRMTWGLIWKSFVYGFISCQRPHVILWLQISYHISNRNYSTVHTHINLQYIPRNMHTVFALLCFVVVIHWLIFPYPSGLLHWHCGNLTIAPVPAKQPWWIWIHTSCEFIMNDCITTTKQSTTKPCAYFLGYTVSPPSATHMCQWIGQHWRQAII